ncbi:DUF5988 family protein [Streptomyces sp. NPDC087844]|uniref:DUF5988 family protein n=1 Tax=Streptomyces sp. NPDC087844 TaxID=3365805 RepID=UPI003816D154
MLIAIQWTNSPRRYSMTEESTPSHDGEMIDALLQGAPEGMPTSVRAGRSAVADRKLKIPHYGGYEHFELVENPAENSQAVFRWTMRTRIAE